MLSLENLILFGGLIHLSIISASILVPFVLKWHAELAKLQTLTRQIVWIHGLFIVMTLIGFGLISLLNADTLANGTFLSRSICGMIAIFWATRLVIQFTFFDFGEHLNNWLLKLGKTSLTVAFLLMTFIYGWAALFPNSKIDFANLSICLFGSY